MNQRLSIQQLSIYEPTHPNGVIPGIVFLMAESAPNLEDVPIMRRPFFKSILKSYYLSEREEAEKNLGRSFIDLTHLIHHSPPFLISICFQKKVSLLGRFKHTFGSRYCLVDYFKHLVRPGYSLDCDVLTSNCGCSSSKYALLKTLHDVGWG
jgi:hypothetical protein